MYFISMSAKVFKEFMEIGEKLGYVDVELREFVNKRIEEYNTSLAEANRVGVDDKKREDDERREERRLARAHEIECAPLNYQSLMKSATIWMRTLSNFQRPSASTLS
jgi:hypothetical protein